MISSISNLTPTGTVVRQLGLTNRRATKTASKWINFTRSVYALRSLFSDNQHLILKRLADIHGPRYRLQLGRRSLVIIGDGPGIRAVNALDRNVISAGLGRKSFLDTFPSKSLIYQSGDRHYVMRRILSFAWQAATRNLDVENETQQFIEELRHSNIESQNGDVESQFNAAKKFLVTVAAKLTIGRASPELIQIGQSIANSFGSLHLVGLMVPLTQRFKRFGAGIQQFRSDTQSLNRIMDEILNSGSYEDSSMLAKLQQSYQSNQLTLNEARDNASFLFTAAIRTMVTFFDNIVSNLAVARDWQIKARQEILSEEINYRSLRATIKETLRMHPVVAAMPRQAMADCEIDGTQIKKGECVVLSPWVSHYDASAFPDPFRFDPSRYLKKRLHENWVPFGGGQNHCIAGNWSTVFMTRLISELLREFELKSSSLGDLRKATGPSAFALRGPLSIRRNRTWIFQAAK